MYYLSEHSAEDALLVLAGDRQGLSLAFSLGPSRNFTSETNKAELRVTPENASESDWANRHINIMAKKKKELSD